MRRILQQGRKLGISEQRLRELTVIAAGRIGKRLQQAMAKELLREPWPAKQRSVELTLTLDEEAGALVVVGQWALLENSCGSRASLPSANFNILRSGNTTRSWRRRRAQPG